MNEVEKLYKNAGIDRIEKGYCLPGYCKRHPSRRFENCETCKQCEYGHFYMSPEFTEHKQLELIKWLARKSHITIGLGLPWGQYDDDWWTVTSKNGDLGTNAYKLEEALADFVNNNLWQSLTKEERKQIRGILE